MSIERLGNLVEPPKRPSEVGSLAQWEAVERQLGVVLPSDYRDFVFTYGTGHFAHFYGVYNPFASSEWIALWPSVQRVCAGERQIKRHFPDAVPYPVYPDQPGLLPWGGDDNGNYYFWMTKGAPDTWKVLSDEVRGEGFQEYGCTMTEFLTGVLCGEFKPLAGDYPKDEDRVFEGC
ncbi:MAG TPA: SMI1/KNR4 family protein [Chthoniobacteraceae bacterium]|nr:SMI1/KNR4 family protein [Chthoniobacteraceae bacterium]